MKIVAFILYAISIPFALIALWQALLFFASLLSFEGNSTLITHFMVFIVSSSLAFILTKIAGRIRN